MHWIALRWPSEDDAAFSRLALAWWALRFTPHVAWVDEALLLEVSGCERLWGGRRALLRRLLGSQPLRLPPRLAQAATSLLALARLRLGFAGVTVAVEASAMPLWTLSAARPHGPVLERLGCRTWGQVDALPRAGLARRFGAGLGRALDVAFGRAADACAWVTLPERFERSLELPHRADTAPALLWGARRLLALLQQWLVARTLGVLALELGWTFDQLRLDGRDLPREQSLVLHTAEPAQGMAHLQRLLVERLDRTTLRAPAIALRLRALETAAWRLQTPTLLPEDQPRGDPLHVLVERVVARFGSDGVRAVVPASDHRPECRQRWQGADEGPLLTNAPRPVPRPANIDGGWPDALGPTWLLRPPHALAAPDDRPRHQGRALRLIAGPRRAESGWWTGASGAAETGGAGAPAARDYFIAQDGPGSLMLVYRERATSAAAGLPVRPARWFLQGFYA